MHTHDENLRVTFTIRLPLRLRALLTRAAYSNGGRGSINAEILARVEASFADEPEPHERQPATPEQSHGP